MLDGHDHELEGNFQKELLDENHFRVYQGGQFERQLLNKDTYRRNVGTGSPSMSEMQEETMESKLGRDLERGPRKSSNKAVDTDTVPGS